MCMCVRAGRNIAHVYVCMYVCMCVQVDVYVCVCVQVDMYVCVCVQVGI